MEEETEKMMALKKAYAEIILNTAKEAAARIMVSERKAHQYRHDLSSSKDEALRLLLRLKQTMDSKIIEAEIKTQDQQRKIEELEAQLQEAEDIVSNLRAELNEAHTKLDNLANNQMCYGSNVMDKDAYDDERSRPGNRSSEVVLAPHPERMNNGSHRESSEEYGYSGAPEVPSIIMRRKEHELYRNGCTQRIRACDGNLLKGHFSLAAGVDHLKNVKAPREDKDGETTRVKAPVADDTTSVEEEEPIDDKEVEDEDPVDVMQAIKLLTKRTKRGYQRYSASSLRRDSHVANEECSHISTSHAHLPGSHDMHESDDEDKGTQSNSPSTAPSDGSEMVALPEHVFSFQDDKLTGVVVEDNEVASSLILTTQQSAFGDSLDTLGSNTELEIKDSSLSNLDVKMVETCDGFASPTKDRVLKYTFQRKRKRESVISDDSSLLHEENPSRKKMAKKQNGNLGPLKSGEVTESLRDSTTMAQVARQLRQKCK